jgi:hypothetical protein
LQAASIPRRSVHPEGSRIADYVLRESKNPFDIQLIDPRLAQLQFGQRKLLSQAIAKITVTSRVDRPVDHVRLFHSGQLPSKVRNTLLELLSERLRLASLRFPAFEYNCSEEPLIFRFWLKTL